MNRFRTYIARLIVAVLVWTGLSLYMVQPVEANHSSKSVANWLSKMAKFTDGAELEGFGNLEKSVLNRGNSTYDAAHNFSGDVKDIDFSFMGALDSQQLYHLLFIDWNQLQTENAMASLPKQLITKLVVSATIDKSGFSEFGSNGTTKPMMLVSASNCLMDSQQLAVITLVPMIHGIAIGAP